MPNYGGNGHVRYGKILEIGPIPPPHAGWGVRIGYLLEAMRDRGIDSAALDVGRNRSVPRDNCETVCSAWDYGWKVWRYLWHGYRIHNHLNGESAKAYCLVFYASLLSLLFRRRSVLTWHGGIPQRWFPRGANRLVDMVQSVIFHLNEKIICNDERIKDHIVAYGVGEQKVLPIPAFSWQYLRFQQAELSPELRAFLDARAPRLFTYVYFRPEFYLHVLVDALKELAERIPNFGMVIVGYGEGSQETRQRLATANIQEHVWFSGDLDRDVFLTLLSQCDVCIRTPKRDGVSSCVLEALALGVPVVAAANALRPPGVVTYPCEDAHALAEAVERVLALPLSQRRPAAPELPDTVADELGVLTGSVP